MKNHLSKTTTITGLALVGIMCFGTLPANAAPAPTQSTATAAVAETANVTLQNRAQITEIFNQVNAHRKANGLKPLMFSVPASEESQNWSKKIAADQKLSHNSNPGTDPRISSASWNYWAENVAARWDDSAAGMFDQWVNSPGHNANMLSPKVNTMGIGIHITGNKDFSKYPSNYYMWGTQNFYNFDGVLPAQTYTHPDDYFEGRAPIGGEQEKAVVIKKPTIDYDRGTYTLPTVEGVEYYVNGVKKAVGTHASNWEKTTIEYRPLAGYYLNTTNKKYSVVIDFTQYVQQVEVASPEFFPETGKYTINESVGVDFFVNGTVKNPGTYNSERKYIEIIAKPKSGYSLTGTTLWSHNFSTAGVPAPIINITPAAPTFDKGANKYTIPSYTGIQYKVNGTNVAAGTYDGTGKQIKVTATAVSGYQIKGTASWSYKFVNVANVQDFKDTRGTAFASEIRWMKASGISTGWADNTYQPFSTIKRDAMAAFIYRMAGSPAYTPPAKSPFKDVGTDNVFYKEIAWLASTGISTGWADGTFRPNAEVNRDTMAAFMYRYGSMCHIAAVDNYKAPTTKKFKDTPADIAFYKEMSWMSDAGISTGWADGTYRPFQAVTREEMAAFLYRLDSFVAKNGGC